MAAQAPGSRRRRSYVVATEGRERRSTRAKRTAIYEGSLPASEERAIRQAMRASVVAANKGDLGEVPACPVFELSEEEFALGPVAFVKRVYSQVVDVGFCKVIPPKSWKLPRILTDDKPHKFLTREQRIHKLQQAEGFEQGRAYTLAEYEKYGDEWHKTFYDGKLSGSVSPRRIEQDFWRIVETGYPEVTVHYGNDIDSALWGSGFPKGGDPAHEQASSSPWNLNNVYKLPGSAIRPIVSAIKGITVPWVYAGTLLSAFCWHFEDHHLYSINYHHFGEPKVWYGAPASATSALSNALKEEVPQLFDAEPDLIFKLVTMVSPAILRARGIPICRGEQRPGEFIITFAKAFHAGFNCGFNCAEAVNFAVDNWLPHGRDAINAYRIYGRPSIFSHDWLVLRLALDTSGEYETDIVLAELESLIQREKQDRLLCGTIPKQEIKQTVPLDSILFNVATPITRTCISCKHICFLSYVSCSCKKTISCARHSNVSLAS